MKMRKGDNSFSSNICFKLDFLKNNINILYIYISVYIVKNNICYRINF